MTDMTIIQKLDRLANTKEAIATAIVEKGVAVETEDTFASYAQKILEISSGIQVYPGTIDPETGKSDLEIYPSKDETIIVSPPEGYDGIAYCEVDKVTYLIDSNIISDNIRQGVSVLGILGSLEETNPEPARTVNPSNSIQTITPRGSYNSLSSVIVNAANNQEKTVTPRTSSQTVQPDYGYVGLSSVKVDAVTAAIDSQIIPSNIRKDVSILGITGIYAPVVEEITLSATISEQIILPSVGYEAISKITLNPITAAIDSNIKPENIKKGVTILSILGTYELSNVQNKVINPTTSIQVITADAQYEALNQVTINAVTSAIDTNIQAANIKKNISILGVTGTYEESFITQNKIVEPTISLQNIRPDTGYDGLSRVQVNPVTSSIDTNIKPENIKSGTTILSITGTYNGDYSYQTKSVSPTISLQQILPDEGYDALSSVSITPVTSSIDSNIQPGNIKQGVTILNVVGTLQTSDIKPYWIEFVLDALTLPISPLSCGEFYSSAIVPMTNDYNINLPMIEEASFGNIASELYSIVQGFEDLVILPPYQKISFPQANLYNQTLGYIISPARQLNLTSFQNGGCLLNYTDTGAHVTLNVYVLYNSTMQSGFPVLVSGAMTDLLLPTGYTDYRFAKEIIIPQHVPL